MVYNIKYMGISGSSHLSKSKNLKKLLIFKVLKLLIKNKYMWKLYL